MLENNLAKGSRARKGGITSCLYSDQCSNNFHSTGGRIGEFLNFCASLTFYIHVASFSWKNPAGIQNYLTWLSQCTTTTKKYLCSGAVSLCADLRSLWSSHLHCAWLMRHSDVLHHPVCLIFVKGCKQRTGQVWLVWSLQHHGSFTSLSGLKLYQKGATPSYNIL